MVSSSRIPYLTWHYEGNLFCAIPRESDVFPVAVLVGAQAAPFAHIEGGKGGSTVFLENLGYDLATGSFDVDCHHLKLLRVDAKNEPSFSRGINSLKNWSVAGGQTVYLRLSDPAQPGITWISGAVEGSIERDQTMTFSALLASHRAKGNLMISLSQDAERREFKIPFLSTFKGGVNAIDHQSVSLPIKLKKGQFSIRLFVEHQDWEPDGTGLGDCFYFLSNSWLRLSDSNLSTAYETSGPLFTSSEAWTFGSEPSLYRVHLGPLDAAGLASLSIVWTDESRSSLYDPSPVQVDLLNDYGYAVNLRFSADGCYSLYINSEYSSSFEVGSGDRCVQIPSFWLRGEPCILEVRDSSGSLVFLREPICPPRFLTPPSILLDNYKSPFPTDLTCRANHRYQALRAHLRHPIPGITQDSLLQALETLDADYATLKLKPLSFPEVAEPEVSVVIPAHNKVEATYYALSALLLAHNTTSFEVILVDDGSTDETAELEELVGGIRVIRNEEPLRFIKACNKGVSAARGTYVVLLNNDTEVTGGWLDAMVDAFQRFDGVGAVGSKLLFPDGTLQDAGGIIWGSGNPWNYGRKQNPWDPRFCYTRQVDYLSGAALMTTKAIWDEVGGLSTYLEPMYFDDTDFSFKVREAGYKTYFVPASVVYHFEGVTGGTDTSSGFKKYQEVNRPKFKRRWAKAFANHGEEGVNPDLEKDRGIIGRVLFIDYTTPREDRDAGSYAAIREIELVQALGYKVTFLPQNLSFFGNYTEELQRMGVEVITSPFYLSLAAFLEQRAKEFDAAYITRYYVAADTVHLIREHSPKTRIILNNADLHFLRELRAAISENDEAQLGVMRDVRNQELAMMRSVDLVLSYNDVEHAVISSHTDGAVKVMTCPWVVDIPETVAPLAGREGLSFLGSFNHHPNSEGVQWFCREVMPHLQAHQLKLSIYGSGMDDSIKDLASDWIDPVGYIEDVADAYQRHRVFAAPLLSGAGIKGKVMSALAYGIPTVLTPTAAEGIGLRHGHDCLIVKTVEEWVEAITRLSKDDELWIAMSKASRAYVRAKFSFKVGRETMMKCFEEVDLFPYSV